MIGRSTKERFRSEVLRHVCVVALHRNSLCEIGPGTHEQAAARDTCGAVSLYERPSRTIGTASQ
jgi:hypothetical protein